MVTKLDRCRFGKKRELTMEMQRERIEKKKIQGERRA
jgi:hypothetical protein